MTTLKIKRITKKTHEEPIPVYCVNVPPEHEIVVSMTNSNILSKNSINFGLLFGAQATTVMQESIKPNWKEKEADDYIKANKLKGAMKEHYASISSGEYTFLKSQNPSEDMLNAKFYTIAVDVREKFFKAYSGLATWIDETRSSAKQLGYVVSVYGSIRRLPYLLINGKGFDVNKRLYSNYLNIALNSPIQNMEAIVMNRGLLEIYKVIKERGLKDKIFAQIHDAQEFYMYYVDESWQDFVKLVHEKNEADYPEYKGIPLEVESNVADYYGKGELWDMGPKVNPKYFKKAV
jgi:DNA polymerase I-like protein with 3'-5' exonuclease and polymerase domains